MATVRNKAGQSVYDLCLQTYGTLDMLITFANDNGVTDLQAVLAQKDYYFDEKQVRYEGNTNIYTTLI
jgi:hypothetical protein